MHLLFYAPKHYQKYFKIAYRMDALDHTWLFFAVVGDCLKPDHWTNWYGENDLNDEGDDATIKKLRKLDRSVSENAQNVMRNSVSYSKIVFFNLV